MYDTSFKFVALNIKCQINMQTKTFRGVVVTGDGTGSFQTVNLRMFKPEKEK